ncbi:MAG: hypothetical protein NC252_07160 [Roseburia sp.]|nr:hypothetical protein [Roseburia sp.]MCM1421110.1 beta-glycosidase [Bacteroides sp.]
MTVSMHAQSVKWIQSTEENYVQSQKNLKLQNTAAQEPALSISGKEEGHVFRAWGTTFNEQNWRALQMLTREEQDEILSRMFSKNGELQFSRGRIGMNANDYALEWWSCDEVDGDFALEHFNIERDRQYIIPYIRAAQKYCPEMTFWTSPWCPPSWMKANHHYAVQSSKYNDLDPRCDALLYGDNDRSRNEQVNPDKRLFPRRLATNDYFIQDSRYLQCYANYFCRFIEEYQKENIPITMVMYQNEAYSYTPYPGCAWTSEGIIRFNMEYLAPTLKKNHPEVNLYLGTFNTNRYEHVDGLLSDKRMPDNIKGLGFQWEGLQILPRIHDKYPAYDLISTESECGNGSMNWKAAEHTFDLLSRYVGNGCTEYYNWNAVLCDNGESAWGWKQNALIQVDSKKRTYRYTPEYYAYMHYSHYIPSGSTILGFRTLWDTKGASILVARTPKGQLVAVVCNYNNEEFSLTIEIKGKYLNAQLPAHSFHTYII